MKWRMVPDTNVVIASRKSPSKLSPSREILERWILGEFEVLYTLDTILTLSAPPLSPCQNHG